jgi:hypothetical protein
MVSRGAALDNRPAFVSSGKRPFNVQAHFVRQLWAGNGKRDKMIVGRQSGREGQFDVDRVGREAANEAAVRPCVQIMNLDDAVLLRPEVLRASALRSAS